MTKVSYAPSRFGSGPQRIGAAPKVAASPYRTPEWRALVARLKRQRGDRCEECGASGCRILGDHVVELRDGGPLLDPNNVKLVCDPCHGKKTQIERRKRAGLA